MKFKNFTLQLFGAIVLISITLIQVSCNSKTAADVLKEKFTAREKLARQYCGSCHLPVSPSLLDKETWTGQVLPAMAKQLKLEVWQNKQYYQNENSAISYSDWMEIVAYYDSLAPKHLPLPEKHLKAKQEWSIFTLKKPEGNISEIATTTLAVIDRNSKSVYTSNSETAGLYQWNNLLQQTGFSGLPSPAVQMNFEANNETILTCIGEMKALDVPSGNILTGKNLTDKADYRIIASNFIRPIHTNSSDFDKNGLTDYVVCSFGHNKGGLYWLKQLDNKTFETIPIRETAGATQSVTGDFNNDGWPDIMALFAHGDEGIWLFTNNKKGGFESKNILRFPPVYGSSSFQLADINRDGKLDIVYTAGDNSDYSRILKPYNGLYIFKNTGNFTFEKTFFYPINGSTKAIVTDLNMDGKMDIAAIAFFADFEKNPSESFIYFENTGAGKKNKWDFNPFALPIYKNGRWICMDANDYDGDGDQDIILGNYSKGFLNQDNFQPNWNVNLPFVILENKVK